jgi:hypothetical protein
VGKSSNLLGVDIFLFSQVGIVTFAVERKKAGAVQILWAWLQVLWAWRGGRSGVKKEGGLEYMDERYRICGSPCFCTSFLSSNAHSDLMSVISMDACF